MRSEYSHWACNASRKWARRASRLVPLFWAGSAIAKAQIMDTTTDSLIFMTSSLEQMKHPREMTTPEYIRREKWRFDSFSFGRSGHDDLQGTYRGCFEADGQSSGNYRP